MMTAMTEQEDVTHEEVSDMSELMEMDSQRITWNIKAIHATKNDLEIVTDSNIMTSSPIKIGIIDSGVEVLGKTAIEERINLVDREGNTIPMQEDLTGHETSIVGIINTRDDDYGWVGVNPKVDLFDIKVFDDVNQVPLSRIIERIQYAIEKDIKVLNMSFNENYVVGSWYAQQSGGHNGTIESTGYLTSEVKLLKKAANNADEGNYSATKNKPVNLVLQSGL